MPFSLQLDLPRTGAFDDPFVYPCIQPVVATASTALPVRSTSFAPSYLIWLLSEVDTDWRQATSG